MKFKASPGYKENVAQPADFTVWAPDLFASFQWASVSPVAAGVTEIRPAALSSFPNEGLEGYVCMLPASTTRLCRSAVRIPTTVPQLRHTGAWCPSSSALPDRGPLCVQPWPPRTALLFCIQTLPLLGGFGNCTLTLSFQ